MMAICPRKYQRPRIASVRGCGRPRFGRYLRRKMVIICPPLSCSCYRPAAGATLQGLCRKGYAAHAPTAALATQIGMLQLMHWPHTSACSNCCTGHTDRHAPTAALATQISMPHVLHWPHRSACSKCCTGHTDQHAPTVALATQIGMLQLLHWPHRSTCPKCCTGRPAEHAPTAALATRISILDMHCCSTRKRWSAHNAEAF